MGVCTEQSRPYRRQAGTLTVTRAKEARRCPAGAYYRVRPDIAHVHAAINEVGILFCSAQVHKGWDRLTNYDNSGVFDRQIPWRTSYKNDGGHAFAVVGYNEDGLWIVNSWGPDWGVDGVALWSYPDWQQNVSDMWVVQPGLPTPLIDRTVRARSAGQAEDAAEKATRPRRDQIAGRLEQPRRIGEPRRGDAGRMEGQSDLPVPRHVRHGPHGGAEGRHLQQARDGQPARGRRDRLVGLAPRETASAPWTGGLA